ncbi:hypothetical protein GMAR_ORF109 [Golden Marseillevirus]|uniref:hypothetical protein n=1 Tax=Golden Marseillevirus TaxID=1720526 RepID=UPI000877ADA0|nr:hypothetical protein GMAR_ORF109 [Golden Marseillevirus]ALX27483.1 hypothetical protein GMAR_ORF109 [Golden Marseillevirus]
MSSSVNLSEYFLSAALVSFRRIRDLKEFASSQIPAILLLVKETSGSPDISEDVKKHFIGQIPEIVFLHFFFWWNKNVQSFDHRKSRFPKKLLSFQPHLIVFSCKTLPSFIFLKVIRRGQGEKVIGNSLIASSNKKSVWGHLEPFSFAFLVIHKSFWRDKVNSLALFPVIVSKP